MSQSMMNMFFAISGVGGAVIGGTLMNFRWRRIAEDRSWDTVQVEAFRVRELYDRAAIEHSRRVKVETDTREWIGDLLDKVKRLDSIIQRSRTKKIQRLVRLSKGWRVLAKEKIAFVVSLWPGGSAETKIAWDNWPIYSDI